MGAKEKPTAVGKGKGKFPSWGGGKKKRQGNTIKKRQKSCGGKGPNELKRVGVAENVLAGGGKGGEVQSLRGSGIAGGGSTVASPLHIGVFARSPKGTRLATG